MNDHPLGAPDRPAVSTVSKSIVDTIFDLGDLMSADIRRAEKIARFSVRPELEADIEEREAELQSMTDASGNPLVTDDELASSGGRSVHTVNAELLALQKEYMESMRSVRVRAVPDDEWTALQTEHRETLAGPAPYTPEFYADVIVKSAISPKFTAEDVTKFRQKMGAPAFDAVFQAAWHVNTQSGVSIPKSLLSSVIQRLNQRG